MLEPRTLRDAHAKAIVALGGFIGVGVFRHPMLQPIPQGERFSGFVEGSCDEVIAHALHLASVVGPERVVPGTDLGAPIVRALPGGACPDGLRGDWDLPALFAGLEARGFPAAALDGSAARFLSMLEEVETRSRRSAR